MIIHALTWLKLWHGWEITPHCFTSMPQSLCNMNIFQILDTFWVWSHCVTYDIPMYMHILCLNCVGHWNMGRDFASWRGKLPSVVWSEFETDIFVMKVRTPSRVRFDRETISTAVPAVHSSDAVSCVSLLTHWIRATHICVSKLTIIGSDNGLSQGRHQAIIWTNAGKLLILSIGTSFCKILSKILHFLSRKYMWKWRLGNSGKYHGNPTKRRSSDNI